MLQLVSPVWTMEGWGSCQVVTLCLRQNDQRERHTQHRAKSPEAHDGTTHMGYITQIEIKTENKRM